MKDAKSYQTKLNEIVLELFTDSRETAGCVEANLRPMCVCDGDVFGVSSSSRQNPAAATSVVLWDSGNT